MLISICTVILYDILKYSSLVIWNILCLCDCDLKPLVPVESNYEKAREQLLPPFIHSQRLLPAEVCGVSFTGIQTYQRYCKRGGVVCLHVWTWDKSDVNKLCSMLKK